MGQHHKLQLTYCINVPMIFWRETIELNSWTLILHCNFSTVQKTHRGFLSLTGEKSVLEQIASNTLCTLIFPRRKKKWSVEEYLQRRCRDSSSTRSYACFYCCYWGTLGPLNFVLHDPGSLKATGKNTTVLFFLDKDQHVYCNGMQMGKLL